MDDEDDGMIHRPGEDVDEEDAGTDTVEATGDKGVGSVYVSAAAAAALETAPYPEIAALDSVEGGDDDDATLMMIFQEGSDGGLSSRSPSSSAILSWGGGGDIGLLAAIASTLALTDDAVLWSGLREVRGHGFGGDPHSRWVVLWDLILRPGEALVLNDLPLWDLAEVLLKRRRVDFCGNDDNHPRGRRHCRRQSSRLRRWWRLKTLPLLRSLQRLWRQWILLVCPARRQGSPKEELMIKSASRRIV